MKVNSYHSFSTFVFHPHLTSFIPRPLANSSMELILLELLVFDLLWVLRGDETGLLIKRKFDHCFLTGSLISDWGSNHNRWCIAQKLVDGKTPFFLFQNYLSTLEPTVWTVWNLDRHAYGLFSLVWTNYSIKYMIIPVGHERVYWYPTRLPKFCLWKVWSDRSWSNLNIGRLIKTAININLNAFTTPWI